MATLRYWAAARAAAGVGAEELPAATLAELLESAAHRHGPELARVLALCSFLVDGASAGRRDPAAVALTPAAEVDALPPFAGG